MHTHTHHSHIARVFNQLQSTAPLVQCLTNKVVMEVTANALLAAGASPAMCDTPTESYGFAAIANGVLINAGTPSTEQYAGMRAAVDGANAAGTPWVLDPVACGGLQTRTDFQRDIVTHRPAAVRGNASEIIALANISSHTGGRGVDSTDSAEAAIPAAQYLSDTYGCVVAISGATDIVVSQTGITRITSGDPMMQLVIGTGCALGALCAAYLGSVDPKDYHWAIVAAHGHSAAAGVEAARVAHAPGSFRNAWLDSLYTVTADDVVANCHIEHDDHASR